jgi:hypothetical protein
MRARELAAASAPSQTEVAQSLASSAGVRTCEAAGPGASRLSVREAAAVLVALALVGLALPAWHTAQSGYQSLQSLTRGGPSHTDRELGLGLGGKLNGALLAARRVIPQNATFSVRVGLTPPVDSSFLDGVPGLFRYWLLPRRYTDVAHSADWIITFNHPSETLGVSIRKVVALGPGTNAVEVAH